METELGRPKIKICGITNSSDARVISSAGADYAGFICYKKSKRYITPEKIVEVSESLYDHIKKVGVFVNSNVDYIKEVYEKANLDIVQLHGEEHSGLIRSLEIPYFKVIRVNEASDISLINEYKGDSNCYGILLDSFSSTEYGGTGIRVNRTIIDQALSLCSKNDLNMLIAGGISKFNLREFSGLWRNIYGFDLSSSVEIKPGLKNPIEVHGFFDEYHRIQNEVDQFV